MIVPINGHLLIEPAKEETAFQTSEQKLEERGTVLAIDEGLQEFPNTIPVSVGDSVFFDSWASGRYKDSKGDIHWVVPYDHIRAVEKDG